MKKAMKILVFADIHGNVKAANRAVEIALREQAQKTVFCGDLFGGFGGADGKVAEAVQSIDGVLYFVRGNNDYKSFDHLLRFGFEENAVMFHFGRTLFFTHGHRHNGYFPPPFLKEKDAIVFGHTHFGALTKRNGLFSLNVGSLAQPRGDFASYLVLDERGATLKQLCGTEIYFLPWN